MANDTYNGWTNRATWLVNVWGNPESRADVEMIKSDLEEQYDALGNCLLADLIDLQAINWDELLEHFDEETDDTDETDDDTDGTEAAS